MIKHKKIVGMLFREKPLDMLLNIFSKQGHVNYASNIAKEIDCTYSHVVKILQECERAELVEFLKIGRIKEIKLTKRGIDICKNTEKTLVILSDI